jgi:DNA primase
MAGKIPQEFIDELLNRIDIVDVVSGRLQMKQSGSNFSACCPFHNEKTPSFSVSQSKQFYYCFGCHASGSAISFLMNYDQLHFVEAIEQLAGSIGLEVPRDATETNRQNTHKPLYEIMQRCTQYYAEQLKKTPLAVEYLKRRNLSGETAKKFGLGYATPGWSNLESAVKANNEQLLSLGMQIKNNEGRIYDRFRERIMFPIRDRRGRVIGFGGRILDQGEPKYLNSPETILFHKGEELYGYYEARKSIHDAGKVIIVEGYMDVIALSQHNVENTVATLGTATTPAHIQFLYRTIPELVFCFDGDRAGREAAWRALKVTLPELQDGRDAHFLFLADGEDPDSFVSSKGKAAFEAMIDQSMSVTEFLVQHLSKDLDLTDVGGKAKLANLAKPLIDSLPQGVYKQLMQQRLESVIGTQLKLDNQQPSSIQAKTSKTASPKTGNTHAAVLRRAVILVLQKPMVTQQFAASEYTFEASSVGGQLLMQLISLCKQSNTETLTTGALLEHFRETTHFNALNKLAFQELLPDKREIPDEIAAQEFNDIVEKLKQQSLQQDVNKVKSSHQMGLLSIRKNRNNK